MEHKNSALEEQSLTSSWHIITGEYPPQPGGVSDYTRRVARGLADAGDEVYVWAPCSQESTPVDAGVTVNRLPDHFGLRSLITLSRYLRPYKTPRRLLVQYVPHAFGWRALNVLFCLWLLSRRKDSVWVMFHEVAFPLSRNQTLPHKILGLGTRLTALLATRSAERIFVSIPAWNDLLGKFTSRNQTTMWLPIPSNIPVVNDPSGVEALRARYASNGHLLIGHFSTYNHFIKQTLESSLPSILSTYQEVTVVLLGRKNQNFRDDLLARFPTLAERIFAAGELSAEDVSRHLQACDLMIQPFPDGVSSRRTTIMASLAHGVPCVTTSGFLTEALWATSNAVALVRVGDVAELIKVTRRLLSDATARSRMSEASKTLYRERFSLEHTVATLRHASANKLTCKLCTSA